MPVKPVNIIIKIFGMTTILIWQGDVGQTVNIIVKILGMTIILTWQEGYGQTSQ